MYFLVPGRIWSLSLAELHCVLDSHKIRYVRVAADKSVFLFDIQTDTKEIVRIFSRLGGFVKIGTVINDPYENIKNRLSSESKIHFTVSNHKEGKSKALLHEKKKLGMQIKDYFKEAGLPSRFVTSSIPAIESNVLIHKQRILDRGFDLCIFNHPSLSKTICGETLAVQDFEGFAARDYKRPKVNVNKGMLPPKLARIMVNLAAIPEVGVVWDPFCGSGTILMEGIMLGYKVVGTDIDDASVVESKANLSWVSETYMISHRQYRVEKHDIKQGIPANTDFDAIVAEPYLGPVRRDILTVRELEESIEKITPVYEAIKDLVASSHMQGKRLVVVVPGFKTPSGWIDMDFFPDKGTITEELTFKYGNQGLQWIRPDSIIRRNIKIYQF